MNGAWWFYAYCGHCDDWIEVGCGGDDRWALWDKQYSHTHILGKGWLLNCGKTETTLEGYKIEY